MKTYYVYPTNSIWKAKNKQQIVETLQNELNIKMTKKQIKEDITIDDRYNNDQYIEYILN